ncbi:cysteine dioxygenase [soil metagenome]|nr:cysteine dioxygenase family protein [Trueperaceae bacterium]
MHERLHEFVDAVGRLSAANRSPVDVAAGVAERLHDLIVDCDFLESAHRRTNPSEPCANLVHVAPDRSFSVVSFVWGPGQTTCVHDHVCWCVVGVLEGSEEETRYRLMGDAGGSWLEPGERRRLYPGEVCVLVPPDEDVHQVRNVGDDVAISIHVYGADIERLGTSINRRFSDLPMHAPGERSGAPQRWRQRPPA